MFAGAGAATATVVAGPRVFAAALAHGPAPWFAEARWLAGCVVDVGGLDGGLPTWLSGVEEALVAQRLAKVAKDALQHVGRSFVRGARSAPIFQPGRAGPARSDRAAAVVRRWLVEVLSAGTARSS